MKNFLFLALIVLLFGAVSLKSQTRQQLLTVLGNMPAKPKLQVDTLERIRLDHGWRYKIKWLAEDSNAVLHTPKDYLFAYVLVPDAKKGQKLPGIVAIHQDGNHNYLGYTETAGLAGDADQHYGLELYERGYIVICPDRFLHADRRRIPKPDTLADVFEVADIAEQHWVGQLQLMGRNFVGKEIYDLLFATDVLCKWPQVDTSRIGAIGHSAGGYLLAYFMFADPRIKAGVSSCGVFEAVDWYAEDAIRKRNVMSVIPGLALVGRTSDYVGLIAPRPFLMTRGLHEWGNGDDRQKSDSQRHVAGTELMDMEARKYYRALNADDKLKTSYFEENGGSHSFPPLVKAECFEWLDKFLK